MASRKLITPKFRIMWPNLVSKETKPDGSEGSFSLVALIPKTDTDGITALRALLKEAADEKFKGKMSGVKNPVKDGDKEVYTDSDGNETPKHPGYFFARMSSNSRPGIIGPDKQQVLDIEEEAYAGRWAIAQVNAWCYDTSGNKGVSFGLNNLMLLEHDDKLLGKKDKPEDAFAPVPVVNVEAPKAPAKTATASKTDDNGWDA